jgi:hypothetical protein
MTRLRKMMLEELERRNHAETTNQLYAFSNDLYPYDWSACTTYVYCSRTGNPGDWVKVNDEGMGPFTMVTKSDLAIFKDDLYIGNQFGSGSGIDLMKMVIHLWR